MVDSLYARRGPAMYETLLGDIGFYRLLLRFDTDVATATADHGVLALLESVVCRGLYLGGLRSNS
jgi:hypothetical protein